MKHITTLNEKPLKVSIAHGSRGECQTSCRPVCKIPCTAGNQSCENGDK